MVPDIATLGDRLKQHRKARDWTQQDVADRVGVRVLAVGEWERNRQNPSPENLVALAKLFGIDPRELGYEPPAWNPSEAPLWFIEAMDALHAKLDKVIRQQERRP